MRVRNGTAFKGGATQDVFVLANGKAVKKTVSIGGSNFDYVQIRDGVKPGDVVIISDMKQFKDVGEVEVKKGTKNEIKPVIILWLLVSGLNGAAQQSDTVQLSLKQVVEMAKAKSIASKQATTLKETKYWEWRTYMSDYKPQLSLNGNIPGYSKTFREVLQPNGTIEFQPVRYNNSALNLALSQSIAKTGGTVFATTQMQRFDDFDRDRFSYNGVPYAIGYSQPLLQYNALKWDQKVEPLKYSESQQSYIESLEEISIMASRYFFERLLAQVNLQIAETNLANTQNILRIAVEKFDMGKISRNEILQLELEQVKAQKAVGIAKRDMEISTLNLRSYIGLQSTDKISLAVTRCKD
jgi:outer membrane protein TolC